MSDNNGTSMPASQVTRLLSELQGQPEVMEQIMPLIYDDLRQIARCQRARMRPGPTLQTTVLVHEAFLKLGQGGLAAVKNRQHLRRLAYLTMRQLIVDYARASLAEKRGGGDEVLPLNDEILPADVSDARLVLAVNDAVAELEKFDSRLAEVVTARFFGGHTAAETAELMDVSERTIRRDWQRARAWLMLELEDSEVGE